MEVSDQTTSSSDPTGTTHQTHQSATPDIRAILERFRPPGFDIDGFVESRKLDIDAVMRATSATFAGAQTIADTQAELLKTVLNEVGDALRTLPADVTKPTELIRKQRELVNEALSSALASMKEIAETTRKSQSEILEIASHRVRSNIEEIRRLAKRPQANQVK
jgi:phasin family protein